MKYLRGILWVIFKTLFYIIGISSIVDKDWLFAFVFVFAYMAIRNVEIFGIKKGN
jgi:hypothetical protein